MQRHSFSTALLCLAVSFLIHGCSTRRAATIHPAPPGDGLAAVEHHADIKASSMPPDGWRGELLARTSSRCDHRVWVSPTGRTAFGVIYMSLPLPVGPDLVLWGFLNEMKQNEGEATLIEKRRDDAIGGLRFVAEGSKHRLRANMLVRGFDAWVVYAGTLRSEPVIPDELVLAERSREAVQLGVAAP